MKGTFVTIGVGIILVWIGWSAMNALDSRTEILSEKRDLCESANGVFEVPGGNEQCWSLETGTRLFPWIKR